MRFRNIFVPFVAGVLVLGCNDSATSPAVSPEFRAAQGDRSEWTLVTELSIPESEAVPSGFYSCINGGLGEETVNFGGPYGIYLKTVTTPSGNVLGQGWIRSDYDAVRGVETGDLWVATLDAKYREFSRTADGHLLLHEPIIETATNERTGERVRVVVMFHLELDEFGNLVERNMRYGDIIACHAGK